jgi:hypothetical protein
VEPVPLIDIYEKSGCFYQRLNVQNGLNPYYLKLVGVNKILFPRMRWSDRKIEEFERQSRLQLLKKFLIIGDCRQRQDDQPDEFVDKDLEDQNFQYKDYEKLQIPVENKPFIALYNIEKESIDKIKLLHLKFGDISCINYGPFDNGYLLIGLSSGVIVALELHDLEIVMQEQIFDCSIESITFEPTNLVFITSTNKELVAINLIKKEMHYMYLELAKK